MQKSFPSLLILLVTLVYLLTSCSSPRKLVDKADKIGQWNSSKAIKLYKKSLRKEFHQSYPHFAIGRINLRRGYFDAAISSFETADKLFGRSKKGYDVDSQDAIHTMLGLSYYHKEDYSEGLVYFDKAIKANSFNKMYYTSIHYAGITNYHLENYGTAWSQLSEMLEQDLEGPFLERSLYFGGASAYALSDFKNSAPLLGRYVSLESKGEFYEDASYKGGWSYFQNGDDKSAIDLMTKSYSVNNNSWAKYYLFMFNAHFGRNYTAINHMMDLYRAPNYYSLRKDATKNLSQFKAISDDSRFHNWLAGIARVKIQPLSARTQQRDHLLNPYNDFFVTVTTGDKLVLASSVDDDDNTATWNDDYVVLDYKIGSPIGITLWDEDVTENERFLSVSLDNLPAELGIRNFKGRYASLNVSIDLTNERPKTTGTSIPQPWSIAEIVGWIGVATIAYYSRDLEIKSPFTKLLSCTAQSQINSYVEDPHLSTIISEAARLLIEQENFSSTSSNSSLVYNSIIANLKSQDNHRAAEIFSKIQFMECMNE